jgi:hypothetical protein
VVTSEGRPGNNARGLARGRDCVGGPLLVPGPSIESHILTDAAIANTAIISAPGETTGWRQLWRPALLVEMIERSREPEERKTVR